MALPRALPTMYTPEPVLRKPPLESDKDHVHNLILQGHSDEEIARHFDVTKDTIWSRRKLWGLPSGSSYKDSRIENELTVLWQACYTVKEIAKVTGMSLQRVYMNMRKYGIRDKPRLGIDARSASLSELRQKFEPENDDEVLLVTHKRVPKWVLVPVDQYQDLLNQNFKQLREES